ncbi:MAG: sensor histidine kinase [Acidimicrobiales bacterium]
MSWLPRSIRFKTTALAVVLVAVVLGVTSVLLLRLYEQQLLDSLDQSLEQRGDQIIAALGTGSGDPFVNSNAEDRLAQLLDPTGVVRFGTDNLAGVAVAGPLDAGDTVARTTSNLPLEDDAFRLVVRGFAAPEGVQTLVVGENIDDLDDTVRTLRVLLSTLVPLVVVVLGGLVWWLVGRTLRPVEDIRSRVATIELDRLAERVPDPGTDDEVARLARTMNAMLDRLDESADRQRRFVADASHELRSPLTRIRSTLEVDLASGDADLRQTCTEALDAAVGMQVLIDNLLFLARRDAGSGPDPSTVVDLDVVVDEEVQLGRGLTELEIDQSGVSAAVVRGNRSQLHRLVANLVDNAVRYAEQRVVVTLDQSQGRAWLVVDDDGPGIDPADRTKVFDRFTRLDDARSVDTGGTGLGLAIVGEIVAAHDGHVVVSESASGGARVTVDLPAL